MLAFLKYNLIDTTHPKIPKPEYVVLCSQESYETFTVSYLSCPILKSIFFKLPELQQYGQTLINWIAAKLQSKSVGGLQTS